MKDLEALITDLSQNPASKRRVQRLTPAFLSWVVIAFLYASALLFGFWNPRPDLEVKFGEPLFDLEIISLLGLTITSALSANLLSVPDFYQKTKSLYAPLVVFVLFLFVLVAEYIAHPLATQPGNGMECCAALSAVSLPLAVWMMLRLRRMAVTHPLAAGASALVASFGPGALALRLSEATDSIAHLVFAHYVPLLAFGVLGVFVGKRWLKW